MNHLRSEKSPYLLQHLDNPVDWYPWAEPAFARARSENRLIFLSIGYSTCHWCHVMAHECFEDQEVAGLLNRDYVAVKVDREERPDIDQVYMDVCQRLTRSGGWPLTIIMTPDARPFYAATYLPKHGRHGRPGMLDLLPWVADKWREDPDMLLDAAQDIVNELRRRPAVEPQALNAELLLHAERSLKQSFDGRNGGFGQAPKFPRPHDLTFLLQRHAATGDGECLAMVERTLLMMRGGGIYDQLGYGFHRYSTDEHWLVPHFEKMLYDQAGLIEAYLAAWQATGHEVYAATAREVIAYLLRDMVSAEGAFFSAEDADSEGEEGKFYLWAKPEIAALLGEAAQGFCAACAVTDAGNYRDEATGKVTGVNILHFPPAERSVSGLTSLDGRFAEARRILLAARGKRVRPHLDDKVITAWNGMAIAALASAGRLLGVERYLQHARRAADFIMAAMRDGDGRLHRRYRQGEAAVPAFAEDYAFLARGLLDLYNAEFDPQRLVQALDLAGLLRRFFQDPESGRLYDTPTDGEALLIRPSSTFDGAMPSASAIALELFARLALLTGDVAWQAAADALLKSLAAEAARYPAGYTGLLQSANWLLQPARELVIVGVRGEPATEEMLAAVSRSSLRQTVVLFKDAGAAQPVADLAPFTRGMQLQQGGPAAYLCQDFTCRQPITGLEALVDVLQELPA